MSSDGRWLTGKMCQPPDQPPDQLLDSSTMSPSPAHRRTAACAILLTALVCASCAGPKAIVLDRPVEMTKTKRSLTNSFALEIGNRRTLRTDGLLDLYRSNPDEATRSLATLHQREPTEARRRALAEMCSDSGDRRSAEAPESALGYYLDAAHLTEQAALAAIGREGESFDRLLYNYSSARVARILRARPATGPPTLTPPGVLRDWKLDLSRERAATDPRDFDVLTQVSWLKTKGIKWEEVRQDGFGVAMVGHISASPERKAADPLLPANGYGFPLNASLRFSGNRATLVLQNLMTSATTRLAGRELPLAGDFSAALAFLYHDQGFPDNKLAALFRPANYEQSIRMFAVEPFREDKIPLVLVHGLMSTAEGWLPFLNLLRADPVMRERYQVILFNYPTGNMISRNAADLRANLDQFRNTVDPGRRIPNMRKMVIVGHSMGGIISNTVVRSSGDRLYEKFFNEDLQDLDLAPEKEKMIRDLAFFEANPDIDRAILIAAPLRGSSFASNRIGQLGAWLIRLPFNIVDSVLGDIKVVDALTDVAQEASQQPKNSVNSLRTDNPALPAFVSLPVREGVDIHSIIAQRNVNAPKEQATDGLVTYDSAHLDNATSELVVLHANHRSILENDEAIQEVWRILRLHAGAPPLP